MKRLAPLLGLMTAVLACGPGQSPPSDEPRPLVLNHVNVVDVAAGIVRRDYTVTIADGRIRAVEPAARAALPAQAREVDATGQYLIPGLADMHVHWYDERFLGLFIANGVTTVRQMWGMPQHLDWTRIERGELLGPRSIASAIVDGPNPVWPGSQVVADAAGARETVRAIKRDGFDFVKVYNKLSPESYMAIVSEARAQGLPVAGHVPFAMTAGDASDAGNAASSTSTPSLARPRAPSVIWPNDVQPR